MLSVKGEIVFAAVVELLSPVWVLVTPLTVAPQPSQSFTISQSWLKLMSIESVITSNNLILCRSCLHLPSVFPSLRAFSNECICEDQVAKVLELWLQHQSFQWIFRIEILWNWLVGSPCSSRNSQESSLTPQFKSIDSSALSLPYGPTLTSIYNYWKNLSFDYMGLCQQSDVSDF